MIQAVCEERGSGTYRPPEGSIPEFLAAVGRYYNECMPTRLRNYLIGDQDGPPPESLVREAIIFYDVLEDLMRREGDEMAKRLVRRGERLYRHEKKKLRSAASRVGTECPDDFDSFQIAMDTVEVAFEARKLAEK